MDICSPDQLLTDACIELGFDPKVIREQLLTDTSNKSQTTIIRHVFNLADEPERHARLAGAIAMWHLYQTAPITLKGYLDTFRSFLRDDVLAFYTEHHEALEAEVKPRLKRDFRLSYFAAGTLMDTYLARTKYDQSPKEIPQFCWLRIAVGEFCRDGLESVFKYYHRLSNQDCISASPTIFNMGFKVGAPASCMIYAVDDSLSDILKVMTEAGMASKNNAGIGMDFSGLRHSDIGRQGMSKGIIPLLKAWDDLTIYINQGGRRPGAMTASTRIHHFDTPEFIGLVDRVGEDRNKVTKLKTSIMLCDLFLARCAEGKMWTMFCPKQTGNLNLLHGAEFEKSYVQYEEKAKKWKRYQAYKNRTTTEFNNEFDGKSVPEQIDSREMPADDLMTKICEMQIKTGTPYIVHGCNVNRKNNMCNVGPVRSLNLCQEITIPAVPGKETGCCNLSSISLKQFVTNKKFDFIKFGEVVRDTVCALNRVIDVMGRLGREGSKSERVLNEITQIADDYPEAAERVMKLAMMVEDEGNEVVSAKVTKSNSENRPIGIGVSGFAEMCYMMDLTVTDINQLPSDGKGDSYKFYSYKEKTPSYTEDALKERVINPTLDDLNYIIWSCMLYNAYLASSDEAEKFGQYKNFPTSPTAEGRLQYHLWQEEERVTGRRYSQKLEPASPQSWGQEGSWDQLIKRIKTIGLRNSLLLTCMPTASTAQIIENTESTEFPMQNIYARRVQSGDYPVPNFHLVDDLKAIGMWSHETYNELIGTNGSILGLSETGLSQEHAQRLRYLKEKYLTMREIPQMIMIQLAAQRQVFIDHSQSFNLYLAKPTVAVLKRIHTYTAEMGMKTGMYYLHTGAPNGTMKLKLEPTKIVEEKAEDICKLDADGKCLACS